MIFKDAPRANHLPSIHASSKLLITNADDLGLTEAVTNGIIDCAEFGFVKSTSLLVNMPTTQHAVALLRRTKSINVGVHLNATTGRPIAPPEKVSLLVGKDGMFAFDASAVPSSLQRFKQLFRSRPDAIDQTLLEFRSQVNRCFQLGLTPSHINVHHFLSLLAPDLFDGVIAIAGELGVPYRGRCVPIEDSLALTQEERKVLAAKVLRSPVGWPTVSLSCSCYTRSIPSATSLVRLLKRSLVSLSADPNIKAVELILHPQRPNRTNRMRSYFDQVRSVETALASDRRFFEYAESLGYRHATWSDLKRICVF